MRCLVFLSFVLILSGCNHSTEKDLPRGLVKDSIIPRSEMISILVDVHILEADLQIQRNKNMDPVVLGAYYYKKLFSRYKMTGRRFKMNLAWYETDPENLRKMYEEVVSRLD